MACNPAVGLGLGLAGMYRERQRKSGYAGLGVLANTVLLATCVLLGALVAFMLTYGPMDN